MLDAEIVWCQEEPMNMGAYSYISPRLFTAMKALGRGSFEDIKYVGRAPSAATATGFLSVHAQEQSELVKKALQAEPIKFLWCMHRIYSNNLPAWLQEHARDFLSPGQFWGFSALELMTTSFLEDIILIALISYLVVNYKLRANSPWFNWPVQFETWVQKK